MAEFRDSLSGLVNKLTGTGTDRDKITAQEWYYNEPSPDQLRNSYRANWVCRKTVDAPVQDMLRQGWTWQADEADVEKIVALEKAMGVAKKIAWAKRMANLYGGAAILIGDGSENPENPLELDRITRNGLQYLTVFTRYEITSGNITYDMLNPDYGLPENYLLSGEGQTVTVHPSRIVRFTGREPALVGMPLHDTWGDSVLAGVLREIGAYAVGVASTSRMLEESTVNYYRMKGFLEKVSTDGGTEIIHKALNLLQQSKSAINAVVVDAEDGSMDQFTADFAGLPEVVRMLLQVVAGAADIPLTRLLGTSPTGMNATGESDIRNYYDRLKAEQENEIAPGLNRIGEAVIRSALGTMPDGCTLEFNPLWQLSEKEQADVDSTNASTLSTLGSSGHVPDMVMRQVTRNILTDSPTFPGAAQAYEEAEAAGKLEETSGGNDTTEATTEEMEAANQVGDAAFWDGTPRPLYVRRDVLNAKDLIAWAKRQGFKTTVPADQMHVTIAFSRQPVDWHKAGEAWDEKVEIGAGGPRTVEQFGENAVVLEIAASALKWRHEALRRAGASWDHEGYRPHITLTYEPGDVDLDKIEPYRGPIKLGPEIFETIKENWKETITEDGKG